VLIALRILELDGNDLRREPLEVRKQTLASLLRSSLPGVQLLTTFQSRDILQLPLAPCGVAVVHWAWDTQTQSDSSQSQTSRPILVPHEYG